MAEDIYKIAARTKLRFPTSTGELTVEQLFQLPLKTAMTNRVDLDGIARSIDTELQSTTRKSYVDEGEVNPRNTQLQVMFDIVKDVIKTKQEENSSERNRIEKLRLKQKLLDAISAKRDEKLTASSIEDLEKQVKELGL